MKIKVIGKANFFGTSKKTGKPYDFNQVHYIGKSRGVQGEAALTLNLASEEYPLDSIQIGATYNVEFDSRGYVVAFDKVN